MKNLLILIHLTFGTFLISLPFIGCNSLMKNLQINQLTSIDSTISFRGIYTVSDSEVWITGSNNSVFRTINNGNSWNKIVINDSLTLDFRDVHVNNRGEIFIMSSGPSRKSRIYCSTNRGIAWDTKYVNPYKDGFLNSIAFWNDSTGIAVGDPVKNRIFILLTKDGGISWHESEISAIPPALPGEIGFAASGTSIAVFRDSLAWIGTGGSQARIYYSTDIGNSWNVVNTPILHGGETTGIYSVQFLDEYTGYIAGGDYNAPESTDSTLGFTKDGGQSWKLIGNQQVPFQSAIGKIQSKYEYFISTGTAGTYYSKDGINWELLTDLGFNCLSTSPTGKAIWLAGSNGRVAQIIVNKWSF